MVYRDGRSVSEGHVALGCSGPNVEGGVRGGEKCGYLEDGGGTSPRTLVRLNLHGVISQWTIMFSANCWTSWGNDALVSD